MKGKLIVFEGPDRVGKTSLSQIVSEKLNNEQKLSRYFSFPGKEAGTLGEVVYNMHHNPTKFFLNEINSTSLQLLHIASHIDLIISSIYPLYDNGYIIILDRFWWSTYVYGKLTGIGERILKKMIEIENYYWNGISPDLVFLIEREDRNEQSNKIKDLYSSLAYKEKNKYKVININNNSSITITAEKIFVSINELLYKK